MHRTGVETPRSNVLLGPTVLALAAPVRAPCRWGEHERERLVRVGEGGRPTSSKESSRTDELLASDVLLLAASFLRNV